MPGIVPGTFDLVFGIGLIVATAVAMWFRLGVPPHLDRHREALTGRFNRSPMSIGSSIARSTRYAASCRSTG